MIDVHSQYFIDEQVMPHAAHKVARLRPLVPSSRRRTRKRPTLRLSTAERGALRRAGLTVADLSNEDPEMVASQARLPLSRCRILCASASFQTLSSVGPSMAADLVGLGFESLNDLAKGNPFRMYTDFSRKLDRRVDPCVEDVFRCAVAQARNPTLPQNARNWWYWIPYRGTAIAGIDEAIDSDTKSAQREQGSEERPRRRAPKRSLRGRGGNAGRTRSR